jgi:hypothetical protein
VITAFLAKTAITLGQIVLSFYGFWRVWRVLLPVLHGPPDRDERIAPYSEYFTDPVVGPLARGLHLPQRFVSLLLLVVLAAGQVGLLALSQAVSRGGA